MKVLVAYDGTLQSKEALMYGLEKARENKGELIALHVFNSGLFVDYDAHPRAEEIARMEAMRHVEEAKMLLAETGTGVRTRIVTEEGDPEEEVLDFARNNRIELLLCPPRYRSIIRAYERSLAAEGKKGRVGAIRDDSEKPRVASLSLQ